MQMEREGQPPRERKDSCIYLKEISVEQQTGRSTESIPHVFRSFDKCSSVDQNVGNLRRTRSFTLPKVLKKEKETQSLIKIVFGANTRHKQTDSKRGSLRTNNGQNNESNPNANGHKFSSKQNSKHTEVSSDGQHEFNIPKICIQTPEEVNKESRLTLSPIAIRLQLDTTQDSMRDQPDSKKEYLENQMPATLRSETTTSDRNESRIVARRKRSFSWSDIYSSGALKINTAEVLKGSTSWCAFLDSTVARETDLCSTDL